MLNSIIKLVTQLSFQSKCFYLRKYKFDTICPIYFFDDNFAKYGNSCFAGDVKCWLYFLFQHEISFFSHKVMMMSVQALPKLFQPQNMRQKEISSQQNTVKHRHSVHLLNLGCEITWPIWNSDEKDSSIKSPFHNIGLDKSDLLYMLKKMAFKSGIWKKWKRKNS